MTEVTASGVVKWTNRDPGSLVQASQAQGDSVELALSKRERFDFIWATSAERTAQTGMVQSSRGYQVDTKTEYLYDNSSWRLAIPYAEFNFASKSIPTGGAYTSLGQATVDPTTSTDTTFVVAPVGDGQFRIVTPGVYGFSIYADVTSGFALTGQSQVVVSSSALALGTQYTRGYFSGGRSTMVPMPFYRVTVANTLLHVSGLNDTATSRNVDAILRIGRFG